MKFEIVQFFVRRSLLVYYGETFLFLSIEIPLMASNLHYSWSDSCLVKKLSHPYIAWRSWKESFKYNWEKKKTNCSWMLILGDIPLSFYWNTRYLSTGIISPLFTGWFLFGKRFKSSTYCMEELEGILQVQLREKESQLHMDAHIRSILGNLIDMSFWLRSFPEEECKEECTMRVMMKMEGLLSMVGVMCSEHKLDDVQECSHWAF